MAPSEISDTWIKISYWFLANRKDLTRWWVLLLLAVDIFLVVFFITNTLVAVLTYTKIQRVVSDIWQNRFVTSAVLDRNTPQPLVTGTPVAIPQEGAVSLVVATIDNRNVFWSASQVEYKIIGGSSEDQPRKTFVLPNESRTILLSGAFGSSPTIQITSVVWQRTPISTLPPVIITFTKAQHEFISARSGLVSKTISSVSTQATNSSLYGIKSVKGVAVVKNNQKVVGARQFFIDAFRSRETRYIVIEFPEALPPFTSIEFQTEVNTLDQNTLQK